MIWAASDPTRDAVKRQRDLVDLARLLKAYPARCSQVPAPIAQQLV